MEDDKLGCLGIIGLVVVLEWIGIPWPITLIIIIAFNL